MSDNNQTFLQALFWTDFKILETQILRKPHMYTWKVLIASVSHTIKSLDHIDPKPVVGCSVNCMCLFEEPCDGSRKPHILSLRWVNCSHRGSQFTILLFFPHNWATVWLQGIWVIGKHATFCSWCKANIFFMFIFPLCLYVTDLTLHEATCDILLKCIHEISKLITQPSLFKEISMQPIMCSLVLVLHNITACSNMTKCKANRTKVAQHSLKASTLIALMYRLFI